MLASKISKTVYKYIFTACCLVLVFSAFDLVCQVYADDLGWDIFNRFLPSPWSGDTGIDGVVWLRDNVVSIFKWLLVAISIAYLTLYGFMYIMSQGKEDALTEQNENLIWAVLGFAVLGVSNLALDIFNPTATDAPIDTDKFNEWAWRLVLFVEYFLWGIAVLYLSVWAIRLILAQGDESAMEDQKKNISYGLGGLVVVMLADTVIKLVYDSVTQDNAGQAGLSQFTEQLMGFMNFAMGFTAVLAVLVIVIAGIYYVTALGDEDRTGTAKSIIINTIIGFIIMSFAYAIVATFAR